MIFTRLSRTLICGIFLYATSCAPKTGTVLPPTDTPVNEINVRTEASYVRFETEPDDFPLVQSGLPASILFDENDHPGVKRVIGHFTDDLELVSDNRPEHWNELPDQPVDKVIIAGTLGQSELIDRLAASGKIPTVQLRGKWEKFYITTVDQPFENVDQALVIAGSDKRGTIYGLFDLSEKMGVSPWNWWADVPVQKRDYAGVRPGLFTDGEPKVKYRGIFINDEAPALSGWVHERYGKFNHEFYGKVFELILRMKGNYLWPAMWGRSIYDDDPQSPELADEYGVVIGTSHHEPLMRAHVEWSRYGEGDWNYNTNAEVLRDFWRKGMERMGDNESIVTIGMRGDGDEPMSEETSIALLERIVKDQREIIADVTGKPLEETPQMWALYKEVQDYYDKGMRVPDDVTLLLCDDNWGNIRKLPKPDAPPRSGGYGIYYHYDYVGGPRNYKWINTNNIVRVWEQMQMAYEHQVRQVWIVNVGDIKPMELPTDFFLDLAWDPELLNHDRLTEYTNNWATRQFGGYCSESIADLLEQYTKFNSRRKPELLNLPTYSLQQYDEAAQVVADYKALEQQAHRIMGELPVDYYDAFYQLVYFPIAASANINELYFAHNVNQWYAQQQRSATNRWAERVRACFLRDSLLTHYHNHILADGKWNHLMDQTHIGYTYWQQPPNNNMPEVKEIELPETGQLGIWLPGQPEALRGDQFNSLPTLDPHVNEQTFIELFNTGKAPLAFEITSDQPWVRVGNILGTLHEESRIMVSVDWDQLDTNTGEATLTVSSPGQSDQTLTLDVVRPEINSEAALYLESNGRISIKPEEGFTAHNGAGLTWRIISNYGRTGDGVKAFPTTISIAPDALNEATPHLSYDLQLNESGTFDLQLLIGPTIDFSNQGGIRTAVSIDNEAPKILNIHHPDQYNWDRSVSRNVNVVRTQLEIPAGRHQLKIWHLDAGIVFEKIVLTREGMEDRTFLGPPSTLVE